MTRHGVTPHPISSAASTAIAAPPWIAAMSPFRAASIVSPCVASGNPRPWTGSRTPAFKRSSCR